MAKKTLKYSFVILPVLFHIVNQTNPVPQLIEWGAHIRRGHNFAVFMILRCKNLQRIVEMEEVCC